MKVIQLNNKCIFLDRDGVLNIDRNAYTYRIEDFEIISGVPEALAQLKKSGYLLIVITNQAGIAKGLHTRQAMHRCHEYLQYHTHHAIDAFYYSPYHPAVSESLSRKPGFLMFEKAIARFGIDAEQSWMIGDKERDIIPAKKLGIQTVRISADETTEATMTAQHLYDAAQKILQKSSDH